MQEEEGRVKKKELKLRAEGWYLKEKGKARERDDGGRPPCMGHQKIERHKEKAANNSSYEGSHSERACKESGRHSPSLGNCLAPSREAAFG